MTGRGRAKRRAAAPTVYYELQVQLVSGAFLPAGWSPGRVFALPGSCTLRALGEAIDVSFGRWDLGHERDFVVGKRQIEVGSGSLGRDLSFDSLSLGKGDEFDYVFDLGDEWKHRCRVRNAAPDLFEMWDGWKPDAPVPVEGWGAMPDQYGRDSMTDEGPDE